MDMQLSLKEKEVSLVLTDGNTISEKRSWVDDNDLMEVFFPTLENMLTNNNMSITDIDHFSLDVDIPKGYTTARIARTIVKTLNFAHNT
jgi:tRNA A37 threonylcarbamoyladenosine modification protein TsaB